MIKFIRRAGRIIPISEKRMASAVSRAKVDKLGTDAFIGRKLAKDTNHSVTEAEALLSMTNKATSRMKKMESLAQRNKAYSNKFKAGAAAAGASALAGISSFFGGKKKKS